VRIESNLRRLEGVRSIHSSVVDGLVTAGWRPGVPLDVERLKEAVLRWRGGVRYGGAIITVVGVVEATDSPESEPAAPLLRATGTGQCFRLRGGVVGQGPESLHAGEAYRVTGQVIRGGGRKKDEIWLELDHHTMVGRPPAGTP
jgi:hypothetical protein